MCSKGRILFLIKYGITYVDSQKEVDGDYEVIYQKHIMRYQQMFATLAIMEIIKKIMVISFKWLLSKTIKV
ncbi:hypothetical protein, partial [Mycoplasmopsis bovis]|uniref:hypothetical protein n=1 Tax=Mycoplasmopsis bovis TaxID=28903 RepID=UPI003D27F1DC